jgi:hypothetical protein
LPTKKKSTQLSGFLLFKNYFLLDSSIIIDIKERLFY